MTTVLFGDSIAKGIVSLNGNIKTIDDNAASLVAKHFDKEIINVSRYGQTVKRLYDKKIVDQFIGKVHEEEKYAILALGGNDSDFDWKKVGIDPLFDHPPKTPIEEFKEIYEKLISKLKRQGYIVVIATVFPIDSKRYFRNVISKVADPREVIKFLKGEVEQIAKFQESYNAEVVKLAKKHDCPILDIRSKFLEIPKYLDYMCSDGVHPNEKGYEMISNIIIGEIKKAKRFIFWSSYQAEKETQVF